MDDHDDLIEHFDRWWMEMPQGQRLDNALTTFHKRGVGDREGKFMLVLGTDGVGKSFGLQAFVKAHPVEEGELGKRVPAIYVETPQGCTIKSLVTTALMSVGVIPRPGDNQVALTAMFVDRLRELQVRTLIFDEFHHLLNRTTMKTDVEAANWVKGIVNKKICGVVLAGQPFLAPILKSNSELWARRYRVVTIEPFDWNDPEQQEDYRTFLDFMADEAIRLPKPSNLGSTDMALRIHHYSRGRLRDTCALVRLAYELALERGAPCITLDLLAEAVDQKEDVPAFNPFRVAFLEPAAPASPNAAFEAIEANPLPEPRRRRRRQDDDGDEN